MASALPEGTLFKQYRIGKRLGTGAMGDVYAAHHVETGRRAAVKVMRISAEATHNAARRLVEEARVLNAVRHPGIVEIYDVGIFENRRPYLVMELLEGRSLMDHLKAERRLSVAETLRVSRGVLEALAAAHRAGVVHRDLKPSNIFLVHEGGGAARVKVLDFGVARREGREDALTGPAMAVGSLGFMSPEQLQGKAVASSDLYAVGCLAFLMLTGAPVFPMKDLVDAARAHFSEPPPRLRARRPDASQALEAWVGALLEKAVAARPRSAQEALGALKALEAELPRPPAAPEPDSRTDVVPAFTPPSVVRAVTWSPPTGAVPPPAPPPPAGNATALHEAHLEPGTTSLQSAHDVTKTKSVPAPSGHEPSSTMVDDE